MCTVGMGSLGGTPEPISTGYVACSGMPVGVQGLQDSEQFRASVHSVQGISFLPFPKCKFTLVRVQKLLCDMRQITGEYLEQCFQVLSQRALVSASVYLLKATN